MKIYIKSLSVLVLMGGAFGAIAMENDPAPWQEISANRLGISLEDYRAIKSSLTGTSYTDFNKEESKDKDLWNEQNKIIDGFKKEQIPQPNLFQNSLERDRQKAEEIRLTEEFLASEKLAFEMQQMQLQNPQPVFAQPVPIVNNAPINFTMAQRVEEIRRTKPWLEPALQEETQLSLAQYLEFKDEMPEAELKNLIELEKLAEAEWKAEQPK